MPGLSMRKPRADAIEPPGGRRLASESVARDVADRRVAAERPKDRALTDARVPDEHRATVADQLAERIDVLAASWD